MKTYIVLVSETEAKLVTKLPVHIAFKYAPISNPARAAIEQAIDSSPFIKNMEFANDIIVKQHFSFSSFIVPSINHPYLVDLSGYEVKEFFMCDDCDRDCADKCNPSNRKMFVTISPKQDSFKPYELNP